MAGLWPFSSALFSRSDIVFKMHILDGTFFELLPEKCTFTQPVGQCVKCKPAKVEIKGHGRSSSNFLCHLRRVHGDKSVKEYQNYLEQTRQSKRDAATLLRATLLKDPKSSAIPTSSWPLSVATTSQTSKRKADEEEYSQPVCTSVQEHTGSGSECESVHTVSSANSHEECDALSMLWVSKLRKLDEVQRTVAESLITQVLTKAYFQDLTRNTEICDVSSSNMESDVSGSIR